MTDLGLGEIITVFILSAVKLGLAGVPTALACHFSFLETLVVCSSGGIFGVVFFSFLIGAILKGINNFLDNYFPNRNLNKKKFTRKNRFIIKAKRSFGIIGIAAISPVILSIPLGMFLALRFFDDKRKIIFWMSVSVVFWTVSLYALIHFFPS
jgi:hypothetical protein